ncbi:MAG: NAD-dependent epimerase/dehydratase family protein [Pelagibacteraceae bacterium TMED124]|nr:MAG: NAD-dependent epimerase/dehydratase family protein [Pelagibacteraceae bacterium TMED124]|tara:strand:+ start:3037 stop:4008 length:972 start_codon:yes stop_codon:yes gene_type:complete
MHKFVLIAGSCGFIGSRLVQRLSKKGLNLICVDNCSNGKWENLLDVDCIKIECDISDYSYLLNSLKDLNKTKEIKISEIWHLAANSDIQKGTEDINVDFANTFETTLSLLKITKFFEVPAFRFASSSAVYGDYKDKAITEKDSICRPISNYGAMKLASEAVIFASKEAFLKDISIFRFPNVVGTPATHGVIFDFINKLKLNPDKLFVLGNGTQRKQYLYVEDLIDAMILVANQKNNANYFDDDIYNIGPNDSGITVKEIAEMTIKYQSPNAQIIYGLDPQGWVGDVPKFSYNTSKIRSLGWKEVFNSHQAVEKSVIEIKEQLK